MDDRSAASSADAAARQEKDADDGLDGEVRRLAAAEADLREELEMAGGFGELMRAPLTPEREAGGDGYGDDADAEEEEAGIVIIEEENAPSVGGTRAVSLIFGLLGTGILLPWNAFISAEPYFHSRLCRPEEGADGGGGGGGVELWFGLVFNFSGFLALLGILAYKRRAERGSGATATTTTIASITTHDDVSAEEEVPRRHGEIVTANTVTSDDDGREVPSSNHGRKLVIVPLTLYFTMFCITTLLVLLPRVHPRTFLGITLLSLSIFGVCLAVSGTGVISVAGIFPPDVGVGPFFSGQSIGGVAISVANFVAATAEPPDKFWEEMCGGGSSRHGNADRHYNDRPSGLPSPSFPINHRNYFSSGECLPYRTDWATFCYFLLGSSLLAACIAAFFLLDGLPATVHYRRLAREAGGRRRQQQRSGRGEDLTVEEEETIVRSKVPEFESQEMEDAAASALLLDRPENDLLQPLIDRGPREESSSPLAQREEATIESVWRAIRFPAITIFLSAFVTLSLFPAWTSKIESVGLCRVRGRLRNDLFEPLTFLLFNVPDLIARVMAGLTDTAKIRNLDTKLLGVSACRFLLLPLFLLCNSSSSVMPVMVENDLFPLALGVTFAFTNGLCMSMSFMCAPRLISPAEEVQELGSAVMNFSLALGLLFGSCFSFVYNYIGTGQWV